MIIKNERQYKMTKSQIERLQEEMTEIREQHARKPLDQLMMKLQEDSHKGLIESLRSQTREYEKLRGGRLIKFRVSSFLDLPKLLISARIARGWTQRDLAQDLNLHEQKIQQYEADEYASASFRRLYEVVEALGIEVTSSARLKERKPESKQLREAHSLRHRRVGSKKGTKSAVHSMRSDAR